MAQFFRLKQHRKHVHLLCGKQLPHSKSILHDVKNLWFDTRALNPIAKMHSVVHEVQANPVELLKLHVP